MAVQLLGVTKVITSALATVGSLTVHHDTETGRDSLNLLPALLWFYSISTVGCSLTHGETFSQCVQGILSAALGGT